MGISNRFFNVTFPKTSDQFVTDASASREPAYCCIRRGDMASIPTENSSIEPKTDLIVIPAEAGIHVRILDPRVKPEDDKSSNIYTAPT